MSRSYATATIRSAVAIGLIVSLFAVQAWSMTRATTFTTYDSASAAAEPIGFTSLAALGLLIWLVHGLLAWRLVRRAQLALKPSFIKLQGDDHVR